MDASFVKEGSYVTLASFFSVLTLKPPESASDINTRSSAC